MKLLELFSGTKSVGKVAEQLGFEVTSLDMKNADINCDIMNWNYKVYESGYFDVIWASPPCNTFSNMRKCRIGKHGYTQQSLQNDINNIGLPLLRRTEEIIDYLKPKYYFIENPQTGRMKEYMDKPYYDVDYCKYSNWGYQKRTRVWTNVMGFSPQVRRRDCENMVGTRHRINLASNHYVKDGDKIIAVCTQELRERYKGIERIQSMKIPNSLKDRYRIPPKLIEELFNCIPMIANLTK